jgi:hypothetical protein
MAKTKQEPGSRGPMDDGTNKITIVLDSWILAEEAEVLEDKLADFLAKMGYQGSVEDSITGNSTAIRELKGISSAVD